MGVNALRSHARKARLGGTAPKIMRPQLIQQAGQFLLIVLYIVYRILLIIRDYYCFIGISSYWFIDQ